MARIVLIEDKPYKEPIPSLAIRLGIEPYDLMSCLSAADAYLLMARFISSVTGSRLSGLPGYFRSAINLR